MHSVYQKLEHTGDIDAEFRIEWARMIDRGSMLTKHVFKAPAE
jgi:hypothetical protein